MDDCDLQDEPLQIRIMDYDTYSANDAIGKVYVDLNPLLLPPLNSAHSQRHPHEPTQPGDDDHSTHHYTYHILTHFLIT